MEINRKYFGTIDNQDYYLYTIQNQDLLVEVTDFGATLVSFIDKKSNQNIVLNNSNVNEYLKNINEAMGATIGRNANRIKNGSYFLNNQEYKCFINNGPNSLHGGEKGFMYKRFEVMNHQENLIQLHYFSKHLEENFPGNLDLIITYKIKNNNLFFEIEGCSDQDTIFNITNHSYFNLGDKDIFNHYLQIFSNQFALVDENGLTLNQIENINSSFDFSKLTKIKDNFILQHPNLVLAKGYDHNFLFENTNDDLRIKLCFNDLKLSIYSDLPGVHVYSGNYLRNPQQGIAFECQYYPNSINYNQFKKPILLAHEKVKHYIKYNLERN